MPRIATLTNPDFSLNIRTTIFDGNVLIDNLATIAQRFDCRIGADGSDYLRFQITDADVSASSLAKWFHEWIGNDIQLLVGDRSVYRGLCRQMILSIGGNAEIVSLDDMGNEIITENNSGTSAPIDRPDYSQESANHYGRKQVKLSKSDLSATDAALAAERYLLRHAFPQPRPYTGSDKTYLSLTFQGYMWMLDWIQTTIDPNPSVKALIEQVIDDTGQGVISYLVDAGNGFGSIRDNGQSWSSSVTDTGLSLISQLTDMPDSDGNLWRFYIDTNNVAWFEPIDFSPYYTQRTGTVSNAGGVFVGKNGQIEVGKWNAVAGVILRNESYPISQPLLGSPFESRMDRYVESVRYDIDGNFKFETLRDYPETWITANEEKISS